MPARQPDIIRPQSLRSTPLAPRRCALALGISAAMLAPLSLASEQAVVLEQTAVSEQAVVSVRIS